MEGTSIQFFSLGYAGEALQYVDDNVVAHLHGNSVRFINVREGTSVNSTSQENRITGLGVNARLGRLAIATATGIQVVAYPSQEVIHNLEVPPDMGIITSLTFSRNTKRLACISDLPHNRLLIYNLKDRDKEKQKESSSSILVYTSLSPYNLFSANTEEKTTVSVSFQPKNYNTLAIQGNNNAIILNIEANIRDQVKIMQLDNYQLRAVLSPPSSSLSSSPTPSNGDFILSTYQSLLSGFIYSHSWTQDNTLLIGGLGTIAKYDSGSNALSNYQFQGSSNLANKKIVKIISTRFHHIAVTEDAIFFFINISSGEVETSVAVPAKEGAGHQVTSVSTSPSYTSIIVGTSEGGIYTLYVDINNGLPREGGIATLSQFSFVHTGPITSLVCLSCQHVVVTADKHGKLILWDYLKAGSQLFPILSTVDTSSSITCMSASINNNLLAVGSEMGVIRIFDLHNPLSPVLIFRSRLHKAKITAVSVHPNNKFIAVGHQDGYICILDSSSSRFVPIGYLQLPGQPLSLAWNIIVESMLPSTSSSPSSSSVSHSSSSSSSLASSSFVHQLFIAVDHDQGDVYRIVVPEEPPSASYLVLKSKEVQKSLLKINWTPIGILIDAKSSSTVKKQHVFALCSDKKLSKYTIPERTGDPDLMDDTDIQPAKLTLDAHTKAPTSLTISQDHQYMASSGKDGVIVIRAVSSLGNEEETGSASLSLYPQCDLNAGVSCVCFSFDGNYILVAGGNVVGVYKMYSQLGSTSFAPSIIPVAYQDQREISDRVDEVTELTLLEMHERDTETLIKRSQEQSKQAQRDALEKIRKEITDIVLKNKEAQGQLRLSAEELILDLEEKERLEKEGDSQVKKAVEQMQKESLQRDILYDHIIDMCWKPMEQQSAVVKGLLQNIEVSNYGIRKRTKEEEETLAKMKALRVIELKEQRKLRLDAQEENVEEETSGERPGDLLYSSLQLNTVTRVRIQIELLKEVIRDIKYKFNAEVNNALDQKKNEIAKIEEKNARILEIAKELGDGVPVELIHPSLSESELVAQYVMPPKQSVSVSSEKTQQTAQVTKKGGSEAESQYARALKQMMGGSLENKMGQSVMSLEDKDIPLPAHLVGKNMKTLTEEETKEFREWEKRVMQIQEERQKQRKAQETELRKLQTQVTDICNAFDDSLVRLRKRKLLIDQSVYVEELKIVKLSNALLEEEERREGEKEIESDLAAMKKEHDELQGKLADIDAYFERAKAEFEALQQEEKEIERNVRKELDRDVNPEMAETLFKLYKKRPRPVAPTAVAPPPPPPPAPLAQALLSNPAYASARTSALSGLSQSSSTLPTGRKGSYAGTSLDPCADTDTQDKQPTIVDNVMSEKPEELDEAIWSKLKSERQYKIDKEAELKAKANEVNELAKYLDRVKGEAGVISEKMASKLSQLHQYRRESLLRSCDIETLLALKQGQVEIDQDNFPLGKEVLSASLLPRQDIEELNAEIKKLGREKVDLLKMILNERKQIRKKKWENQRLDMIAEDLQEKTKYFQLLRVTKNLQALIKGGGEDVHQVEITSLEKREKHSQKSHEQKIAEREQALKKVALSIQQKQKENDELERRVEQLEAAVSERNRIHSIQTETKFGSEGTKSSKMKRIVQVRKLREIVSSQEEELIHARIQVAKLRKASFPFVDAPPAPAGTLQGWRPVEPKLPPSFRRSIHKET